MMKRLKITSLFVFLLSSINLLGSTEVSSHACIVSVLGVNNCGKVAIVRAVAWTEGSNTSNERLCAAAREAANEALNHYPCEDSPAPQLPI
jgi:hypothetical protein